MRFLRLHSVTAVQKVTYSCHPGHKLGLKERDVKFLTDSRRQSFLGALKDCVVRPNLFLSIVRSKNDKRTSILDVWGFIVLVNVVENPETDWAHLTSVDIQGDVKRRRVVQRSTFMIRIKFFVNFKLSKTVLRLNVERVQLILATKTFLTFIRSWKLRDVYKLATKMLASLTTTKLR